MNLLYCFENWQLILKGFVYHFSQGMPLTPSYQCHYTTNQKTINFFFFSFSLQELGLQPVGLLAMVQLTFHHCQRKISLLVTMCSGKPHSEEGVLWVCGRTGMRMHVQYKCLAEA